MVGHLRAIRVTVVLVFLLLGISIPSSAADCCDVGTAICCCGDSGEVRCDLVCSGSTFVTVEPAIGTAANSQVLQVPEETQLRRGQRAIRAPQEIRANIDRCELPPPPLFINKTLCFLPPPVV